MRHLDCAHRLAVVVALVTSTLLLGPAGAKPALAQAQCTPTFSQPTGSPFSVGAAPNAVASVDMNADGRADLAVVNGSSGTVSILLGDGSGGFVEAPGSPISVGGFPSSIAVGNFNNDAFPDLAVGSPGPNTVSILLGSGSGAFSQEAGAIPLGLAPGGIAVGNFNNDGLVDLAITGVFSSNLIILQGNGFGGFFLAPGSPIAIAGEPESIISGNFNGDGLPDLAITHVGATSLVTVLLGTGPFTFSQAPGSPLNVGSNPTALTVGDFNVDGRFDLAVANADSNSVAILLGQGNGAFTVGTPITSGISNPNGIVTGRFNDDTFEDLAVAASGSNAVVILHGNGAGGFTIPTNGTIAVGQQPVALVANSINGDPTTDLAVVNQGSSNVTILVNICQLADLSVTSTDSPDPAALGADLGYTITVQNAGPDPASNVTLVAQTPPGTTFSQMIASPGWTCTTPAVGQAGEVRCTVASQPVGNATHTLIVRLGPTVPVGLALQGTVTVSSPTQDPNAANNSATASTTITPAAGSCSPRPRVEVVVAKDGANRLRVTLTSTGNQSITSNQLNQVRMTIPANARVDLSSGGTDLTGGQTVTVSNGTQPFAFTVRRVGGTSVHIPLEILDQCGTWKTFVGGGPGAF